MSIVTLAVWSVFWRHKGSPESKPAVKRSYLPAGVPVPGRGSRSP
ncbi:hypothetical protein [Microcoleus sp. Pol12B4]